MISVALPDSATDDFARRLFLACRDAAAKFDCPLVGGDTSVWDQRLAITVAALGKTDLNPILRSGAKVGDAIMVSGRLGGSILGRHLAFEPRIFLARYLASAYPIHAMMDLSDGLAMDLPRLCARSGVGATVELAALPVHPDAEVLSEKDRVPAALHALSDGEDYELLFTMPAEAVASLTSIQDIPLTRIGTITAGDQLTLIDADGQPQPWPAGGWEHRSHGE
jgi:thiamine-monophosphate kinase